MRNQVKQNFKKVVEPLLTHLKPFPGKISLTYVLYKGDKRKCDISNICCVVDKFFCDNLTDMGLLDDDTYEFVPEVIYKWGGIDKENPRCEVHIKVL
jgi:hypothetical protein